jgi:hypothetical protein
MYRMSMAAAIAILWGAGVASCSKNPAAVSADDAGSAGERNGPDPVNEAGAGVGGEGRGGSSQNHAGAAGCGSKICSDREVCVHPTCCQAAGPKCNPLPASGVCPAGSYPYTCPGTQQQGCQEQPCKPAEPFCTPLPAPCSDSLDCTCAATLCAPTLCMSADSERRQVNCGCQ